MQNQKQKPKNYFLLCKNHISSAKSFFILQKPYLICKIFFYSAKLYFYLQNQKPKTKTKKLFFTLQNYILICKTKNQKQKPKNYFLLCKIIFYSAKPKTKKRIKICFLNKFALITYAEYSQYSYSLFFSSMVIEIICFYNKFALITYSQYFRFAFLHNNWFYNTFL